MFGDDEKIVSENDVIKYLKNEISQISYLSESDIIDKVTNKMRQRALIAYYEFKAEEARASSSREERPF